MKKHIIIGVVFMLYMMIFPMLAYAAGGSDIQAGQIYFTPEDLNGKRVGVMMGYGADTSLTQSGKAIGLSSVQTYGKVLIPQAAVMALPVFSDYLVDIVKGISGAIEEQRQDGMYSIIVKIESESGNGRNQ